MKLRTLLVSAALIGPFSAFAAPFEYFDAVMANKSVDSTVATLESEGFAEVRDVKEVDILPCEGCYQIGINFKPKVTGESAMVLATTGLNRRGRIIITSVQAIRF